MKGDKHLLLQILSIVVLLLIGYLIYFVITNSNKEVTPKPQKSVLNVKEECVFDITLSQFNSLMMDATTVNICKDYNRFNIVDYEDMNMYVLYNGGSGTENNKLGLYINGNQAIEGTSNYSLMMSDNLLFATLDDGNLKIYNQQGKQVYDFAQTLDKLQMEDEVFKDLVKKGKPISAQISLKNIDIESYSFSPGAFTFATTTDCEEGQTNRGSTYQVTYGGNNFNKPEFISYVGC